MQNRRAGMTLVEVLVTLGLLAFFAAGTVTVMTSSKGAWQASVGQASVRQALQVVTWRIVNEARNSSATYMTSLAAPPAFSFPSAVDSRGHFVTTADGAPKWQKYVVYYVPAGTQRLLRRELFTVPTDPLLDPALTPAELAAACDGRGTLVTQGATELSLTPDPDTSTAVLSLALQARNPNGRTERLARTITIFARN